MPHVYHIKLFFFFTFSLPHRHRQHVCHVCPDFVFPHSSSHHRIPPAPDVLPVRLAECLRATRSLRLQEDLSNLLPPLPASLESQLVTSHADGPNVLLRERVQVVQDVTVPAVSLQRSVLVQSHLRRALMLGAQLEFTLARLRKLIAVEDHAERDALLAFLGVRDLASLSLLAFLRQLFRRLKRIFHLTRSATAAGTSASSSTTSSSAAASTSSSSSRRSYSSSASSCSSEQVPEPTDSILMKVVRSTVTVSAAESVDGEPGSGPPAQSSAVTHGTVLQKVEDVGALMWRLMCRPRWR